jgi:P4 family phage/plasmid primase-like protien
MYTEFFNKQKEILDKHNIIYNSINIDLKYDEQSQKYKKIPKGMPTYKDITLMSHYDSTKNAMIIPLGERYNNLIGVDVDNKGDTIDFFNDLALENGFCLDTFTVNTINDGKHYYFRLNDVQKKELNGFTASTGLCFSTPESKKYIDIKYNNQVFFGPSYFIYNDILLKYEIMGDWDLITLPDYLYNEILRTYKMQGAINTQTKKIKNKNQNQNINQNINQVESKKINIKVDKEKEARLKLYLDCLNLERFDSRDDWLTIGAIIFNESNSYELFEMYSKKSKKYDQEGCIKLWNSFNDEHNKKASIKRLIEFANTDTEHTNAIFRKAISQDKIAILDILFTNGPSDVYLAYLFYSLNAQQFVYDTCQCRWFYINQFGLYIQDPPGHSLKNKMNDCLERIITDEFKRLLDLITDDIEAKERKKLTKQFILLVKYCTTAKCKEYILNELKLLYMNEKIFETLDSKPDLVGLDNGVFDLAKNAFRTATPDDYISTTTGYDYHKANVALKKVAMHILGTIFPDEKELRYILKTISLGLYGYNNKEKFYIWIGCGGNGKGLLRDIIKMVLGLYYDSMDISYFYKTNVVRADAPSPNMARKKNCRLVISTEPEQDQILKASLIKTLVGNDEMQVRFLNKDSFNYTPKFKLIIQTNNEPRFEGFDGGMKRRVVLIRFPTKFVENPEKPHERKIDETLKEKLKNYKNEFFEIFADHYKLYLEEGLELPDRIAADTLKLIEENDKVSDWLKTRATITNNVNDLAQASILYENFLGFCENKNITRQTFKDILMKEYGLAQKKTNVATFYVGIKLNIIIDETNDCAQ